MINYRRTEFIGPDFSPTKTDSLAEAEQIFSDPLISPPIVIDLDSLPKTPTTPLKEKDKDLSHELVKCIFQILKFNRKDKPLLLFYRTILEYPKQRSPPKIIQS
jgi:hypothetical protein